MNKHQTKRRDIVSFDKSISSNIIFSQPDKYRTLENISKNSDKIINFSSPSARQINAQKFANFPHFANDGPRSSEPAGLRKREELLAARRHRPRGPDLGGRTFLKTMIFSKNIIVNCFPFENSMLITFCRNFAIIFIY